MIQFTGMARCADNDEIEEIISKLKCIPEVKIEKFGDRIEAYYTPDDNSDDPSIGNTVLKVIRALETVETHGFSLIF